MARQSIGVLQAYGGKWHLRCRPPYEEQNARISILVNGIAERPDTFVQTVLGQLQKPLADGAGHTFSACRRAVRFDVRGIDHLQRGVRHSASREPFPSRITSQTPLSAHRRNCLKIEFQLPKPSGRSRHGAPVRINQNTASSTRR